MSASGVGISARSPSSTVMTMASSIVLSQARGAMSAMTAKSTANSLGLATERIRALFAAGQGTALLLELVHGYSREMRSSVVLGLVVVDFVDGVCGMDDGGLDGLFLYDGLNGLVDVVVNVLAGNGVSTLVRVLGLADAAGVLKLCGLSS